MGCKQQSPGFKLKLDALLSHTCNNLCCWFCKIIIIIHIATRGHSHINMSRFIFRHFNKWLILLFLLWGRSHLPYNKLERTPHIKSKTKQWSNWKTKEEREEGGGAHQDEKQRASEVKMGGGEVRRGESESAKCITLMNYHDSLTVRLSSSSSSRHPPPPHPPRRRGFTPTGKVFLWLPPSPTCHGAKFGTN